MERGSHPCPLCDGRGWNINEPSQSMYPCRACGGTGRANERGDGVNEAGATRNKAWDAAANPNREAAVAELVELVEAATGLIDDLSSRRSESEARAHEAGLALGEFIAVNAPPADVGDGFWAGPDAHVPGASAAEAGMAIGAADLLFNMATVLELAEENPATVRCYRRMAHALAEGRYPDDDEYVGCGPRLKRVIQTMTDPENQPHQWALRS